VIDVAFDARITSHMSDGMRAYTNELRVRLPRVAPDLRIATFGAGDNFDAAEQFGMPLWIARRQPRLVHYASFYVPLLNPRPYLFTVHDLIELRFPELGKKQVGPYFRWLVAPVARRARAIVCDDPRTVADIERFLGVRRERIRVVPLGVDQRFSGALPPQPAPQRPYVLYVGNRRRHKDLDTLFRAWASLPDDLALDLRLSGPDDLDGIRERYPRRNGRILALGMLSGQELVASYRGALAYVHPAIVEGFGLPLLEAAALAVPVVATTTSVPAALAADALTFAPGDWASLAGHVVRLVRDAPGAAAMAARLQQAARRLSWDRCAEATAAVYREILS